jgi:hypothetical protein
MNKTPRGIRVIAPPGFFAHWNLPLHWEKTRPLAIRKSPIAADKLCDLKRWTAKDTRQLLVDLAHDGWGLKTTLGIDFLKTALQMAIDELDEKELRIFKGNLARKRKNNDAFDTLDDVICYLWERRIDVETPNGVYQFLGGLRHWSAHAASALLTLYLRQRGVDHALSHGVYQKRVERMRRRGLMLNYAKQRFVVGGKCTDAGATVTILLGKARQTVQVTGFSR